MGKTQPKGWESQLSLISKDAGQCDAGGETGWHKPVMERVCYDRDRGPKGSPGTGGLTEITALPVLDSPQQEIPLVCLY